MSFEASLPTPSGSSPFSYPLPHPDASATPPKPRPPHTPEQSKKLNDLIDHFNDPHFAPPTTLKGLKSIWKLQSGGSSRFGSFFRGSGDDDQPPALEPLDDVEKCYWSNEAFQRCLRATKWDYDAALKRAESTLVWRREFGTEELGADRVSTEGETGKEIIMGYDINRRPVLYMHPYRQNTETGPAQIDFVVWCLERAIDLCPATDPPTDMICLCIDFGANLANTKSQPTSVGQAKRVLDILQTYYCERLGRAVCVNVPTLFWTFYKLVGPFVDPATKEKIRFVDNANATDLVPPGQLQAMFGGDVQFEYDHATYFPAITKLCQERKAANLQRWKKFGNGKCGLSESTIRGAVTPVYQAGEDHFEDPPLASKELVLEKLKENDALKALENGGTA